MSFLTDTLSKLLDPILQKVKDALKPFTKLFDLLSRFWDNITSLWTDLGALVDSITDEIDEWRNFKENISFRTRVINVKSAIDKTQEFVGQIVAAKDAVIDLWKDLKGKFELTGDPTTEASDALEDIEASGFKDILSKFPKLLKGAEKVLGFVAIVADALESIIDAIKDLQQIVDTLKAVREEIETGSTVFLQQKNARARKKLSAGGSIKIRVGSLHPSG